MLKANLLIAIIFIAGSFNYLFAQKECYILSNSLSGTKEYQAWNYISFKPGFSYKSTESSSLHAKIEKEGLFYKPGNAVASVNSNEPENKGIVGTIPGSPNVNDIGIFTYSIPLENGFGFDGMVPNLSIAYNPLISKGMLGKGMNINGMSAISIAPESEYYNGITCASSIENVNYVLDGQRLILCTEASGIYNDLKLTFYLESDPNVRVVKHYENGYSWFQVYSSDGQISEYGRSSDSRYGYIRRQITEHSNLVPPNNIATVILEEKTTTWMLNKKSTVNQNGMTYSYYADLITGFHSEKYETSSTTTLWFDYLYYGNIRLKNIKYTTYKTSYNYDTYTNQTDFYYKPSIDSVYCLDNGNPKAYYYILDSVNCSSDNKYKFNYDTIQGTEKLISVSHYTGTNKTFNSTKFSWNLPQLVDSLSGDIAFEKPGHYKRMVESIGRNYAISYKFGDFDGDGFDDILLLFDYTDTMLNQKHFVNSSAQVWSTNTDYAYALYVNNGNGTFVLQCEDRLYEKDVYVCNIAYDSKTYFYARAQNYSQSGGNYFQKFKAFEYDSNTGNFTEDLSKAIDIQLNSVNDFGKLQIITGDFLALGTAQVIVTKFGNYYKNIGLNMISTSFDNHSFLNLLAQGNSDRKCQVFSYEIYYTTAWSPIFQCFTDFPGTILKLNNIGQNGITVPITITCGGEIVFYEIGDFKGDGNFELFLKWSSWGRTYDINSSIDSVRIVSLIDEKLDIKLDYSALKAHAGDDFKLVDVNNDGKTDVLVKNGTSLLVYVCDGKKFTLAKTIEGFNSDLSAIASLNLNGDFSEDIYLVNSSQSGGLMQDNWLSFDVGEPVNKIEKVIDGMGNVLNVTYKPYRVNSDIKSSYGNHYEFKRTYLPITSNISSNNSNTQFNYQSPYIEKYRGFVGFCNVETISSTGNQQSKSTKEYLRVNRTNNMFDFLVENQKNYLNNQLVEEQIFSYVPKYFKRGSPNSIYFSVLDSLTQLNYLNGSKKVMSFTFDTLNTITVNKSKVQTYDKSSNELLETKEVERQIDFGYHFWNRANCPVLSDTLVSKWRPELDTLVITKVFRPGKDTVTQTVKYRFDDIKRVITEINNEGTTFETRKSVRLNNVGMVDIETFNFPNDNNIPFENRTKKTYTEYVSGQEYQVTYTVDSVDNTRFLTQYWYDIKHRLTSQKDVSGLTSYYYYDIYGRKFKSKDAGGNYALTNIYWVDTNTPFAPDSALYYIKDSVTGLTPAIAFFDREGKKLRTVSFNVGNRIMFTNYCYYPSGQLWKESLPFDPVSSIAEYIVHSYDNFGRNILTVFPDSSYKRVEFNGDTLIAITGKIISGIENWLHTSMQCKNALGDLIFSQDEAGNKIIYEYNSMGKAVSVYIDGKRNQTETIFAYDANGNKTSISDPSAGTITYVYDAIGNLVHQTNANGVRSSFKYDNFNRLTTKTISDTQLNDSTEISYIYDTRKKAKLSTVATNNNYTENYYYDALLRCNKRIEELPNGVKDTVEYEYDAYGRLMKEKFDGLSKEYGFDARTGSLLDVTFNDGINETDLWKYETSNNKGMLTKYSQGNGLLTTSILHDAAGRLQSVEVNNTNGLLFNLNYGYHHDGNISSRSMGFNENNQYTTNSESFVFDALNRLESWTVSGVTKNIVYSDLGQKLNMQTINPSAVNNTYENHSAYNPDSVVINAAQRPLFNNHYLTFNRYNRVDTLRQVDAGNTEHSLIFAYRPDGSRYETRLYRGQTLLQTKYFLGNKEVIIDSLGNQTKHYYLNGANGLSAIYVVKASQKDLYFALSDHLGSICALVDVNGNIADKMAYDPWGRRRSPNNWNEFESSTAQHITDRGYTGHEHLDLFGLINANGRIYDPVLGEFISPDPYVQSPTNPQNFNRYAYCLNNPLSYSDPTGKWIWIPIAVGAVVGAYLGGAASEGWEYNPGKWSWDGDTWAGIGIGVVVGAAAGVGFYYAAPALAQTGFFAHFGASGTVAAYTVTGGISGGVAGYGAGFSGGMIYSDGDWGYSQQSGIHGAKIGATIGSVAGAIGGKISVYNPPSLISNDWESFEGSPNSPNFIDLEVSEAEDIMIARSKNEFKNFGGGEFLAYHTSNGYFFDASSGYGYGYNSKMIKVYGNYVNYTDGAYFYQETFVKNGKSYLKHYNSIMSPSYEIYSIWHPHPGGIGPSEADHLFVNFYNVNGRVVTWDKGSGYFIYPNDNRLYKYGNPIAYWILNDFIVKPK